MARKTGQEEKVEVVLPRAGEKEDPNAFVSINGVGYRIGKGKRSQVPPEVAEELERSERARDVMDAHKAKRLQEAGKS